MIAEHLELLLAAALFVSAAALVWQLVRRDRSEIDALRDAVLYARAKEQSLLNTILDMRVSGGVVDRLARARAEAAPATKVPKPPRSDVEQAIDENRHASSNPRLRKHLGEWARRELEKDPDNEKHRQAVLERLRTWSAVSADDDDDEDEAL